ncbi:hypothetical protein FNYG_14839 [Fusarium nygamai]|uniref:Uncharacterized protein n=1 Tax=Gibberella nygamai TaxID=42673 RepID=A0A2K0UPL9_GIBNY|nr:hypothetical protein FNYG_14839 [Fusarium nygamai]
MISESQSPSHRTSSLSSITQGKQPDTSNTPSLSRQNEDPFDDDIFLPIDNMSDPSSSAAPSTNFNDAAGPSSRRLIKRAKLAPVEDMTEGPLASFEDEPESLHFPSLSVQHQRRDVDGPTQDNLDTEEEENMDTKPSIMIVYIATSPYADLQNEGEHFAVNIYTSGKRTCSEAIEPFDAELWGSIEKWLGTGLCTCSGAKEFAKKKGKEREEAESQMDKDLVLVYHLSRRQNSSTPKSIPVSRAKLPPL